MKLRPLLLFYFLLLANIAVGQDCLSGDLILRNQADIDNFLINYPNCTEIEDNVLINEFGDGIITNLSGLQNITSIGGRLGIRSNDNLTNLTGLEGLTSIGDYLWIENNDNLINLSGLEGLTTLGHNLTIENNDNLTNLSGLEGLTSIGSVLKINNNDNLINLLGLEGLTSIGSSLHIDSNNNLTNLSGLESLIFIGASLKVISNDNLTNLSGLDNLTSISFLLNIRNNNNLISLSGLESLTSIDNLEIWYNDFLTNLSALDGVSIRELNLTGNDNLISLSGLEGLTTIDKLVISDNDALTNLSGLDGLTSIGRLTISSNDNLIDLSGLDDLSSISTLFISRNDNLTSLSNLNGLISIEYTTTIEHNNSLPDLSGLEGLTSIGDYLRIENNPILEYCSVVSICDHIANGGTTNISGNAEGCNSLEEVLFNCSSIGKIFHPVFYDLNENGIIEDGEPIYSNASVTIDPGNPISYSNSINGGIIYTDLGDYIITYNLSSTPNWALTTDSLYNVTLSETKLVDTVYFGITPTLSYSNMESSLVVGNFRCNEWVEFNVYGENTGTNIVDGTLWMEIDSNIEGIEFIATPDTILAPNLYGWHFNDLSPSAVVHQQIRLKIPGPPDFPLGNLLQFQSHIDYSDASDNYTSDPFGYHDVVECSYDPNDKLVNPIYPFNYALIGEPLTYTIRFQNTGNAEAYDVVILDTLDSYLNPASFRVIASSHNSVLSTELKDNQYLSFTFKDIYLPDSTANFEESQGYVMYRIQAYDTIPERTEIRNTAGIYFDLNPPVITNTTQNVMLYTFDADEDGFDIFEDCDDQNETIYPGAIEIANNEVDEDCDGEDLFVSALNQLTNDQVSLFPNPTSGELLIVFSSQVEGELILRDYTGKMILNEVLRRNNQLDVSHVPNGVYILEIKTANGTWIKRVIKI